jgi:hypothetical protein
MLVQCIQYAWEIAAPAADLAYRGGLPGAFGFDLAANRMRHLQAQGATLLELLPMALPTSWMVNADATSLVFRRWLEPDGQKLWSIMGEMMPRDFSHQEWLNLPTSEREAIAQLVRMIADYGGTSLAAVSKVLALLLPHAIPLMDDPAIRFALNQGPRIPDGTSLPKPSAPSELFLPMMDWFADACTQHETELQAIARDYSLAELDGAQVLDRLLWVHSWGNRLRGQTTRSLI